MLLFIVIVGLVLPTLPVARPVTAQVLLAPRIGRSLAAPIQRKALFLSSMARFEPTRSADMMSINTSLTTAGYTVTYLKDSAVTLNVLTTQLNNYEVVIWRTDAYEQSHIDYWYVGQLADMATIGSYSSDFASGALDGSHGVLGVSAAYLGDHLSQNSLSNVKVMIIVSSMSAQIAGFFLANGVQSAIEFSGPISLQFNWIDYLTSAMVRYLASGYDVADAVSNVIVPMITMQLEDELDSMQIPLVAYAGNVGVTIV
jgi:hypothetical protein